MSEFGPIVVKIGGGLLREEGLAGLRRGCAEASELAGRRAVLVVPGGGMFADAVRAIDAQLGLDAEVSHALALQAMDQLGTLLASLLPGAEPVTRLIAPRALGLLAAAPAFAGRDGIPASWAVTSDSLAVLAAGAIGAEQAILLKPADGVKARWPSDDLPLPALTARELRALHDAGGARAVDPYLPTAIRDTGVTIVVRAPGGLGTRITPG